MKKFRKIKCILAACCILFVLNSCIGNKDNIKEIYNNSILKSEIIPIKNEFNESDNTPIQNLELIDDAEKIMRTLTSDELKGRGDDTDGNDKTVKYLNEQFTNIGLDYLFKDTYLHKYNFSGEFFPHFIRPNEEEQNVVGLIKGTNHAERKKAVVITAHIDHVGYGLSTTGEKNQIYYGAIDNASGTTTLLRLAYKLKEMSKETPFETDIIIAGVNHEELGLVGSRALVNDIKDRYESIYNINIDCVGFKGGSPLIVYSSDKRSPELSKLIFEYMDSTNEKIKKDTKIRDYNSDHASFEYNGIQAIFFMDTYPSGTIHRFTDTIDKIDFQRINSLVDNIAGFLRFNDKNAIPKRESLNV
ncbi:M28 family metallopeptidase [Candidatus Arthromitus sp. SFB-rat-Yit]|uniref:M28 family metallopeptidase n=1 Tax=Candidatus Arthromitus sp. SFB-rat-Yit TaxID=1041504 RepID=UPI000227A492|nr:M28 family peptidase [Candidatus Arthromitus sp. SFB-rat-Yit]BAK81558.1 putative peptidase M28 [Candidatus Arthromitus sp. SFB-rat-Yit]